MFWLIPILLIVFLVVLLIKFRILWWLFCIFIAGCVIWFIFTLL